MKTKFLALLAMLPLCTIVGWVAYELGVEGWLIILEAFVTIVGLVAAVLCFAWGAKKLSE